MTINSSSIIEDSNVVYFEEAEECDIQTAYGGEVKSRFGRRYAREEREESAGGSAKREAG